MVPTAPLFGFCPRCMKTPTPGHRQLESEKSQEQRSSFTALGLIEVTSRETKDSIRREKSYRCASSQLREGYTLRLYLCFAKISLVFFTLQVEVMLRDGHLFLFVLFLRRRVFP